jgi:hypothetical protein
MGHLSRSAAALGVVVLLVVGSGTYALASSSGGTITVCVSRHGGALYKAKKCAKRDKRLSWDQVGRVGRKGATGAAGAPGPAGSQGPAGPSTATLPSGQTLRGWFNFDTVAAAADQINGGSISFALHLANAPTVQLIPASGPTTTQCAGSVASPTAAPGFLCVYENPLTNVSSFFVCSAATCSSTPTSDPFGSEIFVHATAAGRFFVDGTWAVTAP